MEAYLAFDGMGHLKGELFSIYQMTSCNSVRRGEKVDS